MVGGLRKRVSGLSPLKRLVYLISPNKISKKFYIDLDRVLSFKNVKFFQLRLKKIKRNKLLQFVNKIKKITKKHKVKFIINDNFALACEAETDGCHMGQLDGSFKMARKKLKNNCQNRRRFKGCFCLFTRLNSEYFGYCEFKKK